MNDHPNRLPRSLTEEFGVPTQSGGDNAPGLTVWELDPEGLGALCVRTFDPESVLLEVRVAACREFTASLGLRPRWLVVEFANGTDRERPLIPWLEGRIGEKSLRWAAWSSLDQIARQSEIGLRIWRVMQEGGAHMHLLDLGEAANSTVELGFRMALHERQAILSRTRAALDDRWIYSGRGIPQLRHFGLRRGMDGYLEVIPELWPAVEYVFNRVRDYGIAHGAWSALERAVRLRFGTELHQAGIHGPLRHRLRKMLQQPGYATGRFSYIASGEAHLTKPVPLPRPIPRPTYDTVQARLEEARYGQGREERRRGELQGRRQGRVRPRGGPR